MSLFPSPTRAIVASIYDAARASVGNVVDLEPLFHFHLDEFRSPLVSLVSVLVENSSMMLGWSLATFDH